MPRGDEAIRLQKAELPAHRVTGNWENVLQKRNLARVEGVLGDFLQTRRWFGGKARAIDKVKILDTMRIAQQSCVAHVLLAQVAYTDHALETYALPLTFAAGAQGDLLRQRFPEAVFMALQISGGENGILYDAMWDAGFCRVLLDAIRQRRQYSGSQGELTASTTRALRPLLRSAEGPLTPRVSRAEQSNTSVFYGDKLILKLFRRLEAGVNPDLEIGRFLTEKQCFPHIPPVAGALEYRRSRGEPITLGILQGYVANEGDAWQFTLDFLSRYFERAVAKAETGQTPATAQKSLPQMADQEPPPLAKEIIGFYLDRAALLGQRTAELHLALAADEQEPDFTPEAFTDFFQRAQFQGMHGQVGQVWQLLRNRLNALPEALQPEAEAVIEREPEVLQRFASMQNQKLAAMRIRTHGDYHLGQVLYTGKDFVIIDFEGEPARSLSERRNKMSALRDVAGMLRSFHYASFAAAFRLADEVLPVALDRLEPWRHFWYTWATASFLHRYLEVAADAVFIPKDADERHTLLDVYTLDKAVYELGYELNNRPQWVAIPLRGILQVLAPHEA